jgi:hypothetical protein
LSRVLESRVERGRESAFAGGEVYVTRGESKAVCGVTGGGDDVQVIMCWMGEVQIADEATQEECLLDVLLAKVGIRWLRAFELEHSIRKRWPPGMTTHLDDIKQLRNDGGHPSEKRWPAESFHLLPITFDLHECALLLGDVLADS